MIDANATNAIEGNVLVARRTAAEQRASAKKVGIERLTSLLFAGTIVYVVLTNLVSRTGRNTVFYYDFFCVDNSASLSGGPRIVNISMYIAKSLNIKRGKCGAIKSWQ